MKGSIFMKKRLSIKSFLSGMVVMFVFSFSLNPVLASSISKNLEVFYSSIKIYVDDTLVTPTDATGKVVEPFIYNGTTYLPVRAISNAFSKSVYWDGNTQSIYLGVHQSDEPKAYLNNLEWFTRTGSSDAIIDWSNPKDNMGNLYSFGYYLWTNGSKSYAINGQYTKMTGNYVISDTGKNKSQLISTLNIYGDDILIYSKTLEQGNSPVKFDIDLSGVNTLKIEVSRNGSGRDIGITDVTFY